MSFLRERVWCDDSGPLPLGMVEMVIGENMFEMALKTLPLLTIDRADILTNKRAASWRPGLAF